MNTGKENGEDQGNSISVLSGKGGGSRQVGSVENTDEGSINYGRGEAMLRKEALSCFH